MSDVENFDSLNEDGSKTTELSEETLNKFDEFNAKIDAEEDAEDVIGPREIDDGSNDDGTVVEEEVDDDKTKDDTEADNVEDEEELVEDEVEDETEETDDSTDDTEIALPARLVQAAHRNGLDDEAIVALGDNAEVILAKMADNSDSVSAQLGELGRLRKQGLERPTDTKPAEEFKIDPDDYTESAGKIEERMNALYAKLDALEAGNTRREIESRDAAVDSFFDSRAKDTPTLGDAKKLDATQLTLRQTIFETSDNILIGAQASGRPMTLSQSLEQAFSIYEGQNAKVTVRNKIVEDSKKRAKQITAKPSNRKTNLKFSSQREKAMDSYAKRMAALGHDTLNSDGEYDD